MKKSVLSIENKVIFVTGAFGLIGKEICIGFLEHGAKVIAAGHNKNDINIIRNELKKSYSSEDFLVCGIEILQTSSIEHCIEQAIRKFNKIDVLINNAAIDAKFEKNNINNNFSTRFEQYPIDMIKVSIDVNIIGTIQMTQAACKQMLKQGFGNIINVASMYSLVAPHQELYDVQESNKIFKPVDYVITKSFIPNYTRYLATFYAKDNIRCNAIAPGGIYNEHDEKFLNKYSKFCPMGRMGDKSELPGPFIFLASDASSYMTGSVLVVDGGWTAW
jgi:NAD(P)-dependent dehydrogenase (short-subunit alcohol dehydrogenase family)